MDIEQEAKQIINHLETELGNLRSQVAQTRKVLGVLTAKPDESLEEMARRLSQTMNNMRQLVLRHSEELSANRKRIMMLETAMDCALTELRIRGAQTDTIAHYANILGSK